MCEGEIRRRCESESADKAINTGNTQQNTSSHQQINVINPKLSGHAVIVHHTVLTVLVLIINTHRCYFSESDNPRWSMTSMTCTVNSCNIILSCYTWHHVINHCTSRTHIITASRWYFTHSACSVLLHSCRSHRCATHWSTGCRCSASPGTGVSTRAWNQ